jgi:hypothetical protein
VHSDVCLTVLNVRRSQEIDVIVSSIFCNKHKPLGEKGWIWEEIQMRIQIVMKRYVKLLVRGESC